VQSRRANEYTCLKALTRNNLGEKKIVAEAVNDIVCRFLCHDIGGNGKHKHFYHTSTHAAVLYTIAHTCAYITKWSIFCEYKKDV
jgi:hypothetical protein